MTEVANPKMNHSVYILRLSDPPELLYKINKPNDEKQNKKYEKRSIDLEKFIKKYKLFK